MRRVPLLLICIANLLQVSVGQRPNMLVGLDIDNQVTLSCLRQGGTIGQPASFTFTNPLDAQETEERSTSSRDITFSILPENETLVSCRLNDGSVDSETVAITALPRYTGTATSILQYVFSDSDTVELTCSLVTGRLHGLITPYEFLWRVKLEGAQSGTDEVTDVNGTHGTFHYRDGNNTLLSVNLSSLRRNVQYSFQCLGRLKRCNSTFSQNQIICGEQTTENNNSPFISLNYIDPVIISTNVYIAQNEDIPSSFCCTCTVTNGNGDVTIKWEINGVVYDRENCTRSTLCTVEERDQGNKIMISTLTVHTGTLDRAMDETTLNIVYVVNQTVSERPEGLSETVEVRSAYKSQRRQVAQLILSQAPTRSTPILTPTTKPTSITRHKTTESVSPEGIVISTSTFSALVILLLLIFTLSHCVVCIFCYFICTNPGRTLGRKLCCCFHKRSTFRPPTIYYESVDLPPPITTTLSTSQVGGSQTDCNLSSTTATGAVTVSINESNSEQGTVNSIHQSDSTSTIDFTLTANSAYTNADTSSALDRAEIVTEQNEAYEHITFDEHNVVTSQIHMETNEHEDVTHSVEVEV